jgi:hypothetical protein
MLCISAAEGEVMVMMNVVFVYLVSLWKYAATQSNTHN